MAQAMTEATDLRCHKRQNQSFKLVSLSLLAPGLNTRRHCLMVLAGLDVSG